MVDPRLCGCCGACGVGAVGWQSAIGFLLTCDALSGAPGARRLLICNLESRVGGDGLVFAPRLDFALYIFDRQDQTAFQGRR